MRPLHNKSKGEPREFENRKDFGTPRSALFLNFWPRWRRVCNQVPQPQKGRQQRLNQKLESRGDTCPPESRVWGGKEGETF